MRNQAYTILAIAAILLFASCSSTKHLPAGDKLYTGASVEVKGAETARQTKVLEEDLENMTRPKPNSRFLGLRIKLWIYNLLRNKKEDSFWGRLRDKHGEPPVLLSSVNLQQNIDILQNHLENKGYFKASVTGDTIVKNKTASAKYVAQAGPQYDIAQVSWPSDSSQLSNSIRESSKKSLLVKGNPYDLDVIRGERNRIDEYLKERGFYYFNPDFILLRVDSTIGNHMVNMYVTVKPDIPTVSREVFFIKDVTIFADYSLTTADEDTSMKHAITYDDYVLVDKNRRYKPSLFYEALAFEKGDVYTKSDHNKTLNRLVNLNQFKFVKNRFELNTRTDSSLLNVYYYLTPMPSKLLKGEITTITRSNNLNGSLISLSWRHRNLFRGGEQFGISFYVGTDVQFSGALRGYNTYRTGAELNFSIPRFVVPFLKFRNRGGYVPRTNIQLGYDILDRRKLYTINSFRAQYGYLWNENIAKQHELYPISVSYVQPLNITEAYEELIRQDTFLARAVEEQFILGGFYQYTYNPRALGLEKINSVYFSGNIDLSGNIAGLFSGANYKEGKIVTIRDVPFAQYIKFEVDGRFYRKIGLHSTWANRMVIGVGMPYGNSVQLPFLKQFFIGGNNSLRGFRSRSVGPGTYRYTKVQTFLPDETGDIKLEMNTEFRPRISGPLYGALFIDAGNIWLWNDSVYTGKPGGQFTKDFIRQLAVDIGFGLRFDIRLFVIRFDVGFPVRKPWEQNPWVIRQLQLNKAEGRRENIVYNLAIGYPF